MPRRVATDPRQADLIVDHGDADSDRSRRQIAAAIEVGRSHVGLDAALAVVQRTTGAIAVGVSDLARSAFLASNLAIDAHTQAVSTTPRDAHRQTIARARVTWANAFMTALHHEPADIPPVVFSIDREPLYIFRDPAPVLIVSGRVQLGRPESERARLMLLEAISDGRIVRSNPHCT